MISVLISTYGTDDWKQLAVERAFPTAEQNLPDEIIVHHDPGGTIATARNQAVDRSSGDWLCFLDADDQLAPGYIHAMRASMRVLDRGPWAERCLFTPAVSRVTNGLERRPAFYPEVDLRDANWLVIGTLIHRTLFDEVGGFRDWGDPPGSNAYEDFALWAACIKAGARVIKVPRAVYKVHIDMASRHRGANHTIRQSWHKEIGQALFPERYGDDWPHHRRPIQQPGPRTRRSR